MVLAKQRQYKVNALEQIHIQVENCDFKYDSNVMIEIFSAWLSDVYNTKQPQDLFNLLETLLFAEFLSHIFTIYQLNEHVTLNQMLSKKIGSCIRWFVFAWFINHYSNYSA